MPLAQVQGARSPLLGLGKAQPSVSAFARQRRANSIGQQLGDRGRTGTKQHCYAYSALEQITNLCIQRVLFPTSLTWERRNVTLGLYSVTSIGASKLACFG